MAQFFIRDSTAADHCGDSQRRLLTKRLIHAPRPIVSALSHYSISFRRGVGHIWVNVQIDCFLERLPNTDGRRVSYMRLRAVIPLMGINHQGEGDDDDEKEVCSERLQSPLFSDEEQLNA